MLGRRVRIYRRGMLRDEPCDGPVTYEIRVHGVLGNRWSAWFEGLHVSSDDAGETVIAGRVTDQAALHGVLTKVRDLGLPLISVRRVEPDR